MACCWSSGNDAAIALADHVSGTRKRFVGLMNEKARLWGLRCTHFASPHGLEPGNRSCAADLAVLARLAMRAPRITRIVGRKEAALPFPIKGGKLYLYGHNPLLRAGYRGAVGLEDRLHRRGGALLRGRGAAQGPDAGGGAAELAEPAGARGETAGSGLPVARGLAAVEPAGLEPATSCLQSRRSSS